MSIMSTKQKCALRTLAAFAVVSASAFQAQAQVNNIGPQIRIDVNATGPTSEVSIATSNVNSNEIVAGMNRLSTTGEVTRLHVAMSSDGGTTWDDFELRPPVQYHASKEVDPMTAYDDRTGTLWVGAMTVTGPGLPKVFYLARKIPGQNAFEPDPPIVWVSSSGLDKPWMSAGPAYDDPNATTLYIGFNFGVIHSNDMGNTWSATLPILGPMGVLPRVGPNGELYLAYYRNGVKAVFLKRSLDGGQTFDPAEEITIATRNETWAVSDGSMFPGKFWAPHFASLAVDANNGNLYCVYADITNTVNGNRNVDLYFTKSTDQGLTWSSPPVVINGDADPPGDQFFPWIEVDEYGNLHMVFLDSRNTVQDDDVEHGMFDAYYAISHDEGANWEEFKLTEEPFDSADAARAPGEQNLGDYMGLARGHNVVYPSYVSTQNGQSDIFTHVITIDPPAGGCCLPDGGCIVVASKLECKRQSGYYQGDYNKCNLPCPAPH